MKSLLCLLGLHKKRKISLVIQFPFNIIIIKCERCGKILKKYYDIIPYHFNCKGAITYYDDVIEEFPVLDEQVIEFISNPLNKEELPKSLRSAKQIIERAENEKKQTS